MSFDSFLGLVDSPVYVVTVAAEGRRAGCLVGFACQCSMSPERFMVWLSRQNHTYRLARHADFLGVHLLPQRHDLAERFGARCSAESDKFAGLDWSEGPDGTPLLTDAAACFVGRVVDRFEAGDQGDHTGFLLAPVLTRVGPGAPAEALRLGQAADITAGHPVPD